MTIKDVEERTGLSRSNIRFYEKEKLIEPSRNESNGYRDYSENDVENIKKIAYLRTLGISIEDIRSIISEKVTLQEILEKQKEVLKNQITDLNKAKLMCEKMLDEESISYEKLQVEQQIDHCRNQHEKGQAEVDRLYRIIREFLYNLLMLHAVGAFSGMGFGIEVFPVASQQMRKKQQCQSTARIDTGPFAGNSQSHADAA